ncbi:MAG: nuclear transport factor 2 family protein [Gammaproteobacteria bacterium]|jgi:hypothetical protein
MSDTVSTLIEEVIALRRDIARLQAREEIRQQITRYGRGQEWLDGSLMDEVFYPDAHVDFGFFVGEWRDYKPKLMAIEAGGETTFHLCAAPQIEFESDTRAWVEVYGIAGGRGFDGHTNVFGGRYFDVWEKRTDTWKIARRVYKLDWHIDHRFPPEAAVMHPELAPAKPRSPEHPLFRRMGAADTR